MERVARAITPLLLDATTRARLMNARIMCPQSQRSLQTMVPHTDILQTMGPYIKPRSTKIPRYPREVAVLLDKVLSKAQGGHFETSANLQAYICKAITTIYGDNSW